MSIRVYFTLSQNDTIHSNDKRFHRKQEFGIVGKFGLQQNIYCSNPGN